MLLLISGKKRNLIKTPLVGQRQGSLVNTSITLPISTVERRLEIYQMVIKITIWDVRKISPKLSDVLNDMPILRLFSGTLCISLWDPLRGNYGCMQMVPCLSFIYIFIQDYSLSTRRNRADSLASRNTNAIWREKSCKLSVLSRRSGEERVERRLQQRALPTAVMSGSGVMGDNWHS